MIEAGKFYFVTKLNISTGEEVQKQILGSEIQDNFPELAEPKVGQHVQDYCMYTITTAEWF